MNFNNENILIGKRIKEARKNAKFTQFQLHELTGISITQLSAYENGNRSIGLQSLKKIADATNTTIDELYCGRIEDKPIAYTLNEGKLIINCITALFEHGVVSIIRAIDNDKHTSPVKNSYRLGFKNYENVLSDYVSKLIDFDANKDNYPNPIDFKNQIIEATSKKLNDIIISRKELSGYNF